MERIVVVGGGFAGVNAARLLEKKLRRVPGAEVTLVNKTPDHVMMTSLHEVAGGRVAKDAVRMPLNDIFKTGNVRIVVDTVTNIDFAGKQLDCAVRGKLAYDYLILATGSEPTYFAIEGAKENSLPLWAFDHALKVRRYIVNAFKRAASLTDKEEIRKQLSFLVAGGGFTGVELVGEMAEWVKPLCAAYGVDAGDVSLCIVEAMSRLMNNMDPKIIALAEKALQKKGVAIRCDAKIVKVDPEAVHLADGTVLDGKLIWSAGIQGNELHGKVDIDSNRRLRIPVNAEMNAKYENVYCIGDTVFFEENGRPIPQTVETALQTSEVAASNVAALIGKVATKPFKSNYHGSMVSIGPYYGVAKIGALKLWGVPAIMMKHLINIHYFLTLGNPRFVVNYLQNEFRRKKYSAVPE